MAAYVHLPPSTFIRLQHDVLGLSQLIMPHFLFLRDIFVTVFTLDSHALLRSVHAAIDQIGASHLVDVFLIPGCVG